MQFNPAQTKQQEDIYVTEGMVTGIWQNKKVGAKGEYYQYVVSLDNKDKFSTFDPNLIKGIEKGAPARIYFVIQGDKGQYKNIVPAPGQAPSIKTYDNKLIDSLNPVAEALGISVLKQAVPYNSQTPTDEPTDVPAKPVSDMVHCNIVTNAVALYSKWLEITAQISPDSLKELNVFECIGIVKEFIQKLEE